LRTAECRPSQPTTTSAAARAAGPRCRRNARRHPVRRNRRACSAIRCGRVFAQPLRRTAASSTSCRSPRWIENCGHRIAREAPERLAQDELAEAIEEDRLAGLDGDARERIAQAERAELARRVREQVDAQADGRISGADSNTRAAMPRTVQRERRREPPMPPPTMTTSIRR
jgi:hypothetical protein